ncbi:MAG: hypothetical protein KDE11_03580 [Rhodobacteraceae bacterium]|nr:hypothetical protein [Paracoccaceae bacterium]
MVLGALIAGTIAGIAAAGVTVFYLGASFWLGLFAWWLVGTAVTLAPLVALALRPQADPAHENLAAA